MIPLGFECPDCGNTLGKNAKYCGCGWQKDRKKKGREPREWTPHPLTRTLRYPKACQSTLCPPNSYAIEGTDLCPACTAVEKTGERVPRIRRIREGLKLPRYEIP